MKDEIVYFSLQDVAEEGEGKVDSANTQTRSSCFHCDCIAR